MTTKRERMYERIRQHGERLLVIFPDAAERDPVDLCKRLRRAEGEASRITTDYCNGVMDCEEVDKRLDAIRRRVTRLLGVAHDDPRIVINRDPRGYALKIGSEAARDMVIDKDWGGYGIIAPDLSRD